MGKSKRLKFFCIILLIVSILSLTATIFSFRIKEIRVMPLRLTVSNNIGLAADNESINFGTVVPGIAGSSVTREITISSCYNCYGFIFFRGQLGKWVSASEKYFKISGVKKITLTARVPAGTDFGDYNGEMIIVLFR